MTVAVGVEHPSVPVGESRILDRTVLARGLATALLVFAVSWFPRYTGGRDPGATALLALAVAAAVLVLRAWRHTPWVWTALLAWLAAAALLVIPATGGGRDAVVAATAYGVAAGSFLLARELAADQRWRPGLLAAVCLGGVLQFGWAFLPWWGSANPAISMVGTYYWHNQFAASLLAPGILGVALVVGNQRPWRAVGWVSAPLALAGVSLSGSKASLALLVLGWVLVVALALRPREGRVAAARRLAAVSGLAVAVALVLPGPPLFDHYRFPLSNTIERTEQGTLGSSGSSRLQYWAEAVRIFVDHPAAGAGYGQVVPATVGRVPADWSVSPLVHNGPLQALAEGGTLLALPLWILLAALALGLLVRLRAAWRGGQLLAGAAVVSALLLLGHSLVDFDWTYTALAVVLAVVCGVALPAGGQAEQGDPAGRGRARVIAGMALVLALAVGGVAAWGQSFHVNAVGASVVVGGQG